MRAFTKLLGPAALAGSAFDVDKRNAENARIAFTALVPPGWRVGKIVNHVHPYGRKPFPNEAPGMLVQVHGPNNSLGEEEAISFWFMPLPFRGGDPEKGGFSGHAFYGGLGNTKTHMVVAMQHCQNCDSWPDWKNEVIKFLKLTTWGEHSFLSSLV